jgi:hypothetical protein
MWLLPSDSPIKIMLAFLNFYVRATCPTNLILLDLTTMNLLYIKLSPTCCYIPMLGPNIVFGTLFSNTLNVCSRNVRDKFKTLKVKIKSCLSDFLN